MDKGPFGGSWIPTEQCRAEERSLKAGTRPRIVLNPPLAADRAVPRPRDSTPALPGYGPATSRIHQGSLEGLCSLVPCACLPQACPGVPKQPWSGATPAHSGTCRKHTHLCPWEHPTDRSTHCAPEKALRADAGLLCWAQSPATALPTREPWHASQCPWQQAHSLPS